MPKVTVVLTSFNHAGFLRESIDSVLAQTFSDFELLIFDDASTDDSWSIIRSYNDPRIRAVRNERRMGAVWGLNAGVRSAGGELVAIHHSDDAWERSKLAQQVAYLDAHPAVGAVFTHVQPVDECGAPFTREDHFYYRIFEQPNRSRHEWLRFFFERGNALCHPSVVIRKSCHDECGLYRHALGQSDDFDMWVRLCLKYEVHVLPRKLVRFRVRDNEANASGSRPDTRLRSMYEIYRLAHNFFAISNAEDVFRVFPAMAEYDRGPETEVAFVVAMATLATQPAGLWQLVALDALYALVTDPERSARLRDLYGFGEQDFLELSGRYDVFGMARVAAVESAPDQVATQMDRLGALVAQRAAEMECQRLLAEQRAMDADHLAALARESELQAQRLSEVSNVQAAEIERLSALAAGHESELTRVGALAAQRGVELDRITTVAAQLGSTLEQLSALGAAQRTEIQEMARLTAERDDRIRQLSAQAAQRTSELDEASRLLAQRADEVDRLKGLVAHRDAETRRLKDVAAGREADMQQLSRLLAERAAELESLSAAAATLRAEVARLTTAAQTREVAQAQLSTQLAESGRELHLLSTRAAAHEASNEELSAQLAQQVTERAHWSAVAMQRAAEVDRLCTQVAELEARVAQSESQYRHVLGSRSWRATRPLRFLARVVRFGLIPDDRAALRSRAAQLYRRLPLPRPLKAALRSLGSRWLGPDREPRVPGLAARTHVPVAQVPGLPDYLMWGVIDWHFRHQRPQHLAQGIAASGRRVFYISPQLVDRDGDGFEIEQLDASGRLFQVKLSARGAPSIYASAPAESTLRQLRGGVAELLLWARCANLVAIVQHPFWYAVASALPDSRLVYDCMDHHEGFGNTGGDIVALEHSLLAQSDLTITTSAWLYDSIAPRARRSLIVRNGADFAHFATPPGHVFRDGRGRKVIGYYGAIAEWFDLDLVAAVARRFSDCLILLIGADTVGAAQRLRQCPNVQFTGEVPYSKLPHYLYAFDVCMLPFRIVPLTMATNPVKVYEYLSAGKPVVAVDLPEIHQFGDLVQVGASAEGFADEIARVLDAPRPEAAPRRAFSRGQTWAHRVELLLEGAESAEVAPFASVVVVTYNNLAFTQACLHSLEHHSHNPRMEVIVVDNASSDGTPEWLRSWVAADLGRRKVVLNTENRGFSAANNQGLAVARGEYLALLNNDTFVTPGWINTLAGHLRRDPGIGVIGPVTNNIGNEARIDIHYPDMDAMRAAAAAYTHPRMGQLMPLRTAAFFCVVLRREVYEAVGPLDEAFGLGFFEDDDYCRRVEQKGWRIACAEDVFIHHHLSASFDKLRSSERQRLFETNKAVYESKWGTWVPHDYRPAST